MATKGILSKGIKFEIADATYHTDTDTWTFGTWSEIFNLQEIPALGGTSSTVEVTTLADSQRQYIKGIKEFGDSLDFIFLYDNSDATANYRLLRAAEESGEAKGVRITLPDAVIPTGHGTQFVFAAQLTASLNEAGVNEALQFTCSAAIQSEMTVTNPNES